MGSFAPPVPPLPGPIYPAPLPSDAIAVSVSTTLAAWLAPLAPLLTTTAAQRDAVNVEILRLVGMDLVLAEAAAFRGTIAPDLTVPALAVITGGPGPGITTGAGLPTHPGTAGETNPLGSWGGWIQSQINALVNYLLGLIGGAPPPL